MKNTHMLKTFLLASLLTLSASAFADQATIQKYASPDENQPGCVKTPADLAKSADIQAALVAFGGSLDAVVGTWKLSNIPLVNQRISFKYSATGFLVQTNMEPPQQVAICPAVDDKGNKQLRISVFTPGCPENKNIYIRGGGKGVMYLKGYATKAIGTATFKQRSPIPLPDGHPVPPVACAK